MRSILFAGVLLCLAGPALAQLTPEQAIDVSTVGRPSFAPDGRHIAFTVIGAPAGKDSPTDVWVSDLSAGSPHPLTHDGMSDDAQWSPDGRLLAYLSSGGPVTQIDTISPAGGAPTPVTHHSTGVHEFAWSPDGKLIAFLAPATAAPDNPDPRLVPIVSGSDIPLQLWLVDTATGRERSLTSGTFDVDELAWKPDSSGLYLIASERPDPEHWSTRIYSINIREGAPTRLVDTQGPIEALSVSPDGKTLGFLGSRDFSGEAATDLFVVPAAGGAPKNLTGAGIDRAVDQYLWKGPETLAVMVEMGFTNRLYSITAAAAVTPVPAFDPNTESFDLARNGAMAYVHESANTPPELWIRRSGHARAMPLTDLNTRWKARTVAAARLVHYASYDGTVIEAQLLAPAAPAGTRFPTIVLIHGGPVGRWADRFDPEGQMLASHGYAVFYPNIRGAEGYGNRMIGLIRSTERGGSGWATGPLFDVTAGVDDLVRQGLADPARLGFGGWSYGGYMTALALSRTDRFKVGVAGAGFYDMVTDLGTEIASYVPGDEWMYGNFFDPDTQRVLHDDSPIATVQRIHVPLLLMHGELDPVDTISQAYEFYRALQQSGVTTRFIVYPREGHELRERAHIVDRLTRTLDWYERYLPAKAPGHPGAGG